MDICTPGKVVLFMVCTARYGRPPLTSESSPSLQFRAVALRQQRVLWIFFFFLSFLLCSVSSCVSPEQMQTGRAADHRFGPVGLGFLSPRCVLNTNQQTHTTVHISLGGPSSLNLHLHRLLFTSFSLLLLPSSSSFFFFHPAPHLHHHFLSWPVASH